MKKILKGFGVAGLQGGRDGGIFDLWSTSSLYNIFVDMNCATNVLIQNVITVIPKGETEEGKTSHICGSNRIENGLVTTLSFLNNLNLILQ